MSHAVLAVLLALSPQGAKEPVNVVVRGTVLDGEMRPAAGVSLALVESADGDVAKSLAAPLAKTDAGGCFRLEVQVARERMPWLAIGGGRFATQMRELSEAREIDLGALAMAPGMTGAGRVRDSKGAPVQGARVEVTDLLDSREFLTVQREGLRLRCRTVGYSQEGGIFRLPGMVQSAGRLRVSKDGCYDELLQPVGSGDPLDVTLVPAPVQRGRVLDGDGQGIAGATVRIGEASAASDAEGRFAVSMRSRSADQVRVSKRIGEAWCNASKPVAVDDELELRLVPATAVAQPAMQVVARGPDGPVREFTAWASWNPANQLPYRPDALMLARLVKEKSWSGSATDGTATLQGRKQERDDVAMVFVLAKGFALGRAEATGTALGAEAVVVELVREAVLRGRVVDAVSGKPIAGAELIPTQRLSDAERRHYGMGFRSVDNLLGAPTGTRTDEDGRYELRGVMPGACDLFVHVRSRIELPPIQLQITAGEERGDVDFKLAPNVDLRGSIAGPLPANAQVRAHWHRPNMSSSAWAGEFDGTVPLAADGSFTIAGLHGKQYEVQLVCASPPRGGQRLKLAAGIWDGAAPPVKYELANPGPVAVTGKVVGTLPWQRLAVAAMWKGEVNSFRNVFGITGPIALLQPDRTFLLLAPKLNVHLLLFDVLTGAAFEWQQCDLTGPVPSVAFAGAGVAVSLVLSGADGAERGAECTVAYRPDPEHWPAGIGDIVPRHFRMEEGAGMQTDARIGDTVLLLLPARLGKLSVKRSGTEVGSVELDSAAAGPVEIKVGGTGR